MSSKIEEYKAFLNRRRQRSPETESNLNAGSSRRESDSKNPRSTGCEKVIYFPSDGKNYAGLIIGPKGEFLKILERKSGCRILIRGG